MKNTLSDKIIPQNFINRDYVIKMHAQLAYIPSVVDGLDAAFVDWEDHFIPPQVHTPHALEFTERGQTMYITAAWQNECGNRGR
jgi:hypothetical protein